MRHIFSFYFLSILLFCGFCSTSFALSQDRDKPFNIQSDDINFDMKNGIRTYTGNVMISQGSLRIKADKVVSYYTKGKITKAVATGSPARFKLRPDDKPDDIEGKAQSIIIKQKESTLTLDNNAALKQGYDTARGNRIVYNMKSDTLKIQGRAAIAGNQAAKKPNKPIEDPFTHTALDDDETQNNTQEAKITPKPHKKPGRSRLIIQPKKP